MAAVVGGQFGSEAKGLVASSLALEFLKSGLGGAQLVSITNAGAQAGHTTILPNGSSFVCYHLPTIGVMVDYSAIVLTAGSIIDPELFVREINDVAKAIGVSPEILAKRISIHANAAVITSDDKSAEAGSVLRSGSTAKGVGAAVSRKIMREIGATVQTALYSETGPAYTALSDLMHMGVRILHKSVRINQQSYYVIEIPQGTGLSLNNSDFYPHCTSRDCWLGQGLSDAGIHPIFLGKVAMVCRTYPIRVGNPTLPDGGVGYSGPFYGDSAEIKWEDLPGVVPEVTTVTKRLRRIASWSHRQFEDACALNRPDRVYLTFTNYPEIYAGYLRHIAISMGEAFGALDINPQVWLSDSPVAGSPKYDPAIDVEDLFS